MVKVKVKIAGLLVAAALATPATAAEEIWYGSRAGMSVTVVGKSGIGTAKAVIRVEHQQRNAKAYCVDYELDNSMACVRRTMKAVKVRDRVTANCQRKTWVDVWGDSFAIVGGAQKIDFGVIYPIKATATGQLLDGSSASGYGTALATFQALCPGVANE